MDKISKILLRPLLVLRWILILSWSILISCSEKTDKLTIATAANTQYAIGEIVGRFQNKTGVEVDLIVSSSGKHTAQILAGAPYDIFISADLKYPNKLFEAGITTSEPEVYAYGQLVLWTTIINLPKSFSALPLKSLKHIAVPNPETAPYGIAAKEVLGNMGVWDSLSPRFVYGESVAQTNQYIISGAAEAGFTAASIVNAPTNRNTGEWLLIPDSLHSRIAQGVVILKNSTKIERAEKFYQYLLSEESKSILTSYGYKIR